MDMRIVLVRTQENGNIGSVARAMKNFGLSELYLLDPICEIGPDARRFASHGLDVLEGAKVVSDLNEALMGCDFIVATTGKPGGHKTPKRKAITPEQLGEMIPPGAKVALVFGNEASGLPNEILEKVDITMRIPANPKYPILNLAQAVCVTCYELSKKRYEKTVKERPMSHDVRTQLVKYTKEICGEVYAQEHQAGFIETSLEQVYSKAALTEQQGRRIISFYRKILTKIKP